MKKPIAPSAAAVADNIRRFQVELGANPDLQERLSYMRAWYAVRDGQGWLLGPSKFVGYDGFTGDQYVRLSDQHDGRKTEAHLKRWFSSVEDGSPLHNELSAKLSHLLGLYGKAPSTAMRLNVLSSELDTTDADATLVDLLVAVARGLVPGRLARLKTRIAAL